jgi:hypothetical protein
MGRRENSPPFFMLQRETSMSIGNDNRRKPPEVHRGEKRAARFKERVLKKLNAMTDATKFPSSASGVKEAVRIIEEEPI